MPSLAGNVNACARMRLLPATRSFVLVAVAHRQFLSLVDTLADVMTGWQYSTHTRLHTKPPTWQHECMDSSDDSTLQPPQERHSRCKCRSPQHDHGAGPLTGTDTAGCSPHQPSLQPFPRRVCCYCTTVAHESIGHSVSCWLSGWRKLHGQQPEARQGPMFPCPSLPLMPSIGSDQTALRGKSPPMSPAWQLRPRFAGQV